MSHALGVMGAALRIGVRCRSTPATVPHSPSYSGGGHSPASDPPPDSPSSPAYRGTRGGGGSPGGPVNINTNVNVGGSPHSHSGKAPPS